MEEGWGRSVGLDPGGGGYSVWKRVPTAVRPLTSCGCREPRWLKKGGCRVIISSKRGAVIVLIANIVDQKTIIFVLIIHEDSQKYTLVR